MQWLHASQLVIAEVTVASLGVGYELGIAESLDIPVLVLHRLEDGKLSAMISGNQKFCVLKYAQIDEAKACIHAFMAQHGYAEIEKSKN